jgi:hypothetical protein
MGPNWNPVLIEVPITVTLDAYTANDVVGGTLTSDAIPQIKGGGYINWGRLVDGATQAEPYHLYCYTDNPSTSSDADGFVPTEADHLLCFTVLDIPAANYNTTGTEADVAWFSGKDKTTGDYHMFPALPDGKMYFRLVPSLTPDYAAAVDLTMHILFMVL